MKNSDSLRIGVLGTVEDGIALIGEFDSLENCAVVQVGEANFSQLMAIQEQFPHIPVSIDYQAVLQNPELEAVVVAVPLKERAGLARQALQAGKHVLILSPMAVDGEEVEELVAAAQAADRLLAVHLPNLHHPVVAEMLSILKLGEIGRLSYMESAYLRAMGLASEQNVLVALAMYDLALALYLTQDRPVSVTAVAQSVNEDNVPDMAFVAVHYEKGCFSQHHVSCQSYHPVQRFFVSASQGSLVFSEHRAADKLRVYGPAADTGQSEATLKMAYGPAELLISQPISADPLTRACDDFVESIRQGHQPLTGSQLGSRLVKVLAAAQESINNNSQPVQL